MSLHAPEVVKPDIFTSDRNHTISMETLPKYCDADSVWEANYNDHVVPKSNTVWYTVPVVLNGGLITSTGKAFNSNDFLSQTEQLNVITERLLAWAAKQA